MKMLLLVQNETDVSNLDAAAKAILSTNVDDVWLVFSPMVTVDQAAAAKKYDGEIASIEAAARQAAALLDAKGFEEYVLRLNSKKLERATALREAHKTAPAEEKKARVNAIFKPFRDALDAGGVSAKITQHESHFEREQYVEFQKSLTGAWLSRFVIGEFGIHWPGSVPSARLQQAQPEMDLRRLGPTSLDAKKMEEQSQQRLPEVPKVTLSRADELASMKHFSKIALAKKLGVNPASKTLVDDILAAEQAQAVAAPEAVEAY